MRCKNNRGTGSLSNCLTLTFIRVEDNTPTEERGKLE